MTLIPFFFLKFGLRKMCKKTRFRGPFDNLHGKPAETLFKSKRKRLYHIYWSLLRQFKFKTFLWVLCKVLGLFINPLTAHNKYFFLDRGYLLPFFRGNNLRHKIYLVNCFLPLLTLGWIFNFFKKRMTLIADKFVKLQTQKDVVIEMSKKSCFRRHFDK